MVQGKVAKVFKVNLSSVLQNRAYFCFEKMDIPFHLLLFVHAMIKENFHVLAYVEFEVEARKVCGNNIDWDRGNILT